LSSALRRHRGDSATYDVDVRYRWSFGAQTFEGTRYDFLGASTSDRPHWEAIARRLQPGVSVGCWVDPRHPSQATLERDVRGGDVAVFLIPTGITVLAGLGLRALLRNGLPVGSRRTLPGPALVTEAGPVGLVPASTPGRRFGAALLVAALWNGIVWVVFSAWALRPGRGGGAIFGVAAAVFAVVGLYLAYRAVRALVALAAPRVRVTANARQLRLGDRLAVEWTFRGMNDALAEVSVALVGSEIARWREGGGTNASTTKSEVRAFARLPIASAAGPAGAMGSGSILVPDDTVPTFSASNNEIKWAVVVEASLRHLPDLREEFPVVLKPEAR
jgi:hypothetical protein